MYVSKRKHYKKDSKGSSYYLVRVPRGSRRFINELSNNYKYYAVLAFKTSSMSASIAQVLHRMWM